jgi:hypothetical protein
VKESLAGREGLGLPSSCIRLVATHTHSAPMLAHHIPPCRPAPSMPLDEPEHAAEVRRDRGLHTLSARLTDDGGHSFA